MKFCESDPMKNALLSAVGCTVCWFVGSALADEAPANSDKANHRVVAASTTFAALDRNGDRRISRSEAGFDRVLSQTFAEIDTDGDGFVSVDEYSSAEKGRTAANR